MKLNKIFALLTLLSVLIFSASGAQADRSLYLKGAAGPSEMLMTLGDGGMYGASVDLSLAAGVALGTGWVFYGELSHLSTVDGLNSGDATCPDCNLTLSSGLLPGIGAAYYTRGGWNTHLVISKPKATLDILGTRLELDRNTAVSLAFGRDWSLPRRMNAGIAVKLSIAPIDGDLVAAAVSLLFTVSRR